MKLKYPEFYYDSESRQMSIEYDFEKLTLVNNPKFSNSFEEILAPILK